MEMESSRDFMDCLKFTNFHLPPELSQFYDFLELPTIYQVTFSKVPEFLLMLSTFQTQPVVTFIALLSCSHVLHRAILLVLAFLCGGLHGLSLRHTNQVLLSSTFLLKTV